MPDESDERLQKYEAEVIAKVVAGDRDSFRYFVETYGSLVHGMIVQQVRDTTLAKDLFQDVFLRAYRGIGTFRGQSRFGTWVSRIALNVCHSYFDSRSHRNSKNTEELKETLTDSVAIPEPELSPFEDVDIETLRECIGKLQKHYRETVVLCLLEQKSYREASEILEVATGTIGSRLNKAILLLKSCFFDRDSKLARIPK